jgi:uncharacterized protein with PIN domain
LSFDIISSARTSHFFNGHRVKESVDTVVFSLWLLFMVTVKFYIVPSSVWLSVLRFITDGMLGKLTRWLRMLGHDVTYFRSADDEKLVESAKSEKRVLLTRDHKLYQQAVARGLDAVLVEATDEAEKLADLAGRFGFLLEIDLSVSRCPKCNAKIEAVPKGAVVDEIPEATSMHYDDFWKCPGCGQVYWQGAHWKRIETTLEEAKSKLGRM